VLISCIRVPFLATDLTDETDSHGLKLCLSVIMRKKIAAKYYKIELDNKMYL
jgi:hypothetical protein